jgi:hypothetical protein
VRSLKFSTTVCAQELDSRSTIGKYGIGFKSGSIRIGKTAAIVSRSKESNTTSYGLLSNMPFEDDGGQRFVNSVVTEDAEGEPIEGAPSRCLLRQNLRLASRVEIPCQGLQQNIRFIVLLYYVCIDVPCCCRLQSVHKRNTRR